MQAIQTPDSQRGIALIVALVLLIAVTLVGLASIRGTSLQESMTANLNDRDVALQAAEAALRVGGAAALKTTAVQWRDCAADTCADSESPPNSEWVRVDQAPVPTALQYDPGNLVAGTPVFVVEYMGLWPESDDVGQYGGAGDLGEEAKLKGYDSVNYKVRFYRVTARSSHPDDDNGRAAVTLQAWFKG
ncbi:PilX N-terminal domain-containing pilus assembly protein [Guyparkeria hydrothermalis]|uniref:pilus assembly PilX family protein n=1 Tax=Guyparkeria hydrothermalis TaxID=923 RepID=UPI002021D7A1|nr:PilX N-terminal domain-containing pilus assembly protein [Guyparkeria hydrothermalis]MCL7745067.1 PilX N-terminal domain-containing pilus assembly protein [Guyparkeria hydrothermalis]